MEDAIQDNSLITVAEADDLVGAPTGPVQKIRTPLLIFFGTLLIVVAALLILLLLSLRSSETGWQSVLPFLNQNPTQSLQID